MPPDAMPGDYAPALVPQCDWSTLRAMALRRALSTATHLAGASVLLAAMAACLGNPFADPCGGAAGDILREMDHVEGAELVAFENWPTSPTCTATFTYDGDHGTALSHYETVLRTNGWMMEHPEQQGGGLVHGQLQARRNSHWMTVAASSSELYFQVHEVPEVNEAR